MSLLLNIIFFHNAPCLRKAEEIAIIVKYKMSNQVSRTEIALAPRTELSIRLYKNNHRITS
jgi:hypothetical protein